MLLCKGGQTCFEAGATVIYFTGFKNENVGLKTFPIMMIKKKRKKGRRRVTLKSLSHPKAAALFGTERLKRR